MATDEASEMELLENVATAAAALNEELDNLTLDVAIQAKNDDLSVALRALEARRD